MRDLSPNTAKAYARRIKAAEIEFPASPIQVAAYVDKLVAAGRRRQTVDQCLAALARQHHTLGEVFDRRHPLIAAAVSKAKFAPKRRPPRLQKLEGTGFMPEQIARDGLLVYLHGECGLSMETICGLDWLEVGNGTGYLRPGDGGGYLHLSCGIFSVQIWNREALANVSALERCGFLKSGEPVFRPIQNHKGKAKILNTRLTPAGFRWMLKNRRRRAATPSPGSDLPGESP